MVSISTLLEKYSNIQIATKDDNQRILEFYKKEAMQTGGELISFERKNDFFSFYEENSQRYWCYLFLNKDKSIGGVGTVLRQFRLVDDKNVPVAYFCDLRMSESADRIAKFQWLKFFKEYVENISSLPEDEYCVSSYTAILSDNAKAINSLTKSGRGFKYRFIGDYQVTSFISTGVFNSTKYQVQTISDEVLIDFYMSNTDLLLKETLDSIKNKCEYYKEYPSVGAFYGGKLVAVAKLVKSNSRQLKVQNLSHKKRKVLNLGKIFGVKEINENGLIEAFDLSFLTFDKNLEINDENEVISSIQKWIGDNDIFSNTNIVNITHDKDIYNFSKFKHGLNVSTKGKVFEIHPENMKGILPKTNFRFEGAFL